MDRFRGFVQLSAFGALAVGCFVVAGFQVGPQSVTASPGAAQARLTLTGLPSVSLHSFGGEKIALGSDPSRIKQRNDNELILAISLSPKVLAALGNDFLERQAQHLSGSVSFLDRSFNETMRLELGDLRVDSIILPEFDLRSDKEVFAKIHGFAGTFKRLAGSGQAARASAGQPAPVAANHFALEIEGLDCHQVTKISELQLSLVGAISVPRSQDILISIPDGPTISKFTDVLKGFPRSSLKAFDSSGKQVLQVNFELHLIGFSQAFEQGVTNGLEDRLRLSVRNVKFVG